MSCWLVVEMSTVDLALARRLLNGDEAAFEEFFDRYFPRLFRFALPRLDGNEDAAEDVVQRLLICALAHLRTYRGEAALLTWLCTFCYREISAWREHEGKLREVSLFDDRSEIRAVLETASAINFDDPETRLIIFPGATGMPSNGNTCRACRCMRSPTGWKSATRLRSRF